MSQAEPLTNSALDSTMESHRLWPQAYSLDERRAVATAWAWREVARGLASWVESDVAENGEPDCATAKRLAAARGEHAALCAALQHAPTSAPSRPASPLGRRSAQTSDSPTAQDQGAQRNTADSP